LALLEVENVTRRFGGVVALDEVSFSVEKGEIVPEPLFRSTDTSVTYSTSWGSP
jgi:ABC-type phosphonate transport system ATPase subunit